MDLQVDMTVRDASKILDVTPQRVRALVATGALHAIKDGRDLRVSRRDLERLAAKGLVGGRPYTAANAWRRLIEDDLPDESVQAVVARLARRGERHLFLAHPSLLAALAADERLLLSGLAVVDGLPLEEQIVDAYLGVGDLDDVVTQYRLRPAQQATNVILRAVPAVIDLPDEAPALAVALDLVESLLPRVRGVGEKMLQGLL